MRFYRFDGDAPGLCASGLHSWQQKTFYQTVKYSLPCCLPRTYANFTSLGPAATRGDGAEGHASSGRAYGRQSVCGGASNGLVELLR